MLDPLSTNRPPAKFLFIFPSFHEQFLISIRGFGVATDIASSPLLRPSSRNRRDNQRRDTAGSSKMYNRYRLLLRGISGIVRRVRGIRLAASSSKPPNLRFKPTRFSALASPLHLLPKIHSRYLSVRFLPCSARTASPVSDPG